MSIHIMDKILDTLERCDPYLCVLINIISLYYISPIYYIFVVCNILYELNIVYPKVNPNRFLGLERACICCFELSHIQYLQFSAFSYMWGILLLLCVYEVYKQIRFSTTGDTFVFYTIILILLEFNLFYGYEFFTYTLLTYIVYSMNNIFDLPFHFVTTCLYTPILRS